MRSPPWSSAPAGSSLSDRIGRRRVIVGGWLVYALIYLGFAIAGKGWHIWVLYALYGIYYGLAYGTTKAMVADIVPEALRGTAYGTYNAILGLLDFPASRHSRHPLARGVGTWTGFGPSAPFYFGGAIGPPRRHPHGDDPSASDHRIKNLEAKNQRIGEENQRMGVPSAGSCVPQLCIPRFSILRSRSPRPALVHLRSRERRVRLGLVPVGHRGDIVGQGLVLAVEPTTPAPAS